MRVRPARAAEAARFRLAGAGWSRFVAAGIGCEDGKFFVEFL